MRASALPAAVLVLLGSAGVFADAPPQQTCVPGPNRTWQCGPQGAERASNRASTVPEPAAVEVHSAGNAKPSTPPVMLIDPERLFGPSSGPTASRPVVQAPGQVRSDQAPAPEPVRGPLPVPTSPTGQYVVQLARASSPTGFADLLAARGLSETGAQQVALRGGGWLLVYGNYPDIDAARRDAARLKGFAKARADIDGTPQP